ncbi:MAG: biotin/lipoyl-binding protein [Candidatus Pacebacteria bacterium]|nr:biotin/lipoyl-binding protein [Candidatus Paceibacterota bacterium]
MKKHLITFIHKPVLVSTVSLVVAAGILGVAEYRNLKSPSAPQFSLASSSANIDVSTSTDVAASQHVLLSFLSSGRVATVSVKVGDQVKKGMTLATLDPESTLGALTQAQATYASAQANYAKVVNGATASTVDVAQAAIDTASQNLEHILQNSFTQIDNLIRTDVDNLYVNPNFYAPRFEITFFDPTINTNTSLVPSDLNLKLDLENKRVDIGKLLAAWKVATSTDSQTTAQVTLANLTVVKNYLAEVSDGLNSITYDAKYQTNMDKYKANVAMARSAVDTLISSIQSAEQALTTANTNASVVTTSARPEDVAVAKANMDNALGALQIAQANYNGRIIIAPEDGTVTAVHINVGETAVANVSAIEISGQGI